jgi:hypothetical protein
MIEYFCHSSQDKGEEIMKIGLRLILGIAIVSFAIVLFSPHARADTADRAKTVDAVLTKLEEGKASVDSESDFRQKLKEAVVIEEEGVSPIEFDNFVRYIPSRTLKAQDGKISITHQASELSYNFKAFYKLPIELSLNQEYIDISPNPDVPIVLPGHLTSYGFGMQATFPAFNWENVYLRFRAVPSFNTDNWGATSNSFRMPVSTMAIYQPNDKWTFVAGVLVSPSTEGPVTPFGGFIYKHSDALTFNIIPSEPNITYAFNDRLAVFIEGGLSDEEYKVTKDPFNGKVIAYREVHAGAGIKLSINKNIDASLSCGEIFNRALQYRDSLGKASLKNGVYTEFRVEIGI